MNAIVLFFVRLLCRTHNAVHNQPALQTLRRQLNDIEARLQHQLGLRYGVYSIADSATRNRRLDEIADTIRTLRENREVLRRQLGDACHDIKASCCAA